MGISTSTGSAGIWNGFSIFRNPGDGFYTADKKIFSKLSMECDIVRHEPEHAFSKNTISDEKYIDLYKYGNEVVDCVKQYNKSYRVHENFNTCSKLAGDKYKEYIRKCFSIKDDDERITCEVASWVLREKGFFYDTIGDGICKCFVTLDHVTGNFIDPDNKLDFPQ